MEESGGKSKSKVKEKLKVEWSSSISSFLFLPSTCTLTLLYRDVVTTTLSRHSPWHPLLPHSQRLLLHLPPSDSASRQSQPRAPSTKRQVTVLHLRRRTRPAMACPPSPRLHSPSRTCWVSLLWSLSACLAATCRACLWRRRRRPVALIAEQYQNQTHTARKNHSALKCISVPSFTDHPFI